jgi:hypothetical protein
MDFDIDYSQFNLKQEDFDHPSFLHGIAHTYRVMCLILFIGERAGLKREVKVAFCGAYIHDLARKHDGYCNQHGGWSARYKLPGYLQLFEKMGITKQEMDWIKIAVKNHSEAAELSPDDEAYAVTALLKDADALDRFRLGEDNLNPKFLRFKESFDLINFARELFIQTNKMKFCSFTEVLELAKLINR